MERERDLLIHQNILEKEDLVSNHGAMLDSLQADMVSLQRERDDQLIMAENDKQQVHLINRQFYYTYIACNTNSNTKLLT